jgi:hypothetical protein
VTRSAPGRDAIPERGGRTPPAVGCACDHEAVYCSAVASGPGGGRPIFTRWRRILSTCRGIGDDGEDLHLVAAVRAGERTSPWRSAEPRPVGRSGPPLRYLDSGSSAHPSPLRRPAAARHPCQAASGRSPCRAPPQDVGARPPAVSLRRLRQRFPSVRCAALREP